MRSMPRPHPWSAFVRMLRATFAIMFRAVVWLAAISVSVVAFDFYLGAAHQYIGPNVSNLDLYPYDGFRKTPEEMGPLGFWQHDFDFENPPKKEAHEVRLIVIGGSGAQGQGVHFIERTFHPQLQALLNKRFAASGWRVRVLNMASGGSHTYQNFIMLNMHGHQVEPDIILSYAGRNDIFVPFYAGDDSYLYFDQVNYYVTLADTAIRGDEPGLLKVISKVLPNIYQDTPLPFYIKDLFFSNTYHRLVKQRYRWLRGFDRLVPGRPNENKATISRIALPLQVHALKSIKRDFDGIPIVLAWSAVGRNEMAAIELSDQLYWQFFDQQVRQLRGYYNADWLFLNVDAMLADKKDEPYIGTHLGVEGQRLLAELLDREVAPLVQTVIDRRSNHPS